MRAHGEQGSGGGGRSGLLPACRRALAAALAPALAGLLAAGASAQTNDEINAGLQFSFAPPGARSLAMGNAFSGLADDATAAWANPAGLLWLRKPEVSLEARGSTFASRYPDRGSATGRPSLCAGGEAGCVDTLDGVRFAEFDSRVGSLPFVSYVHLFRRPERGAAGGARYREKWRLAVFRHELAAFRSRIDRSEGAFLGGPGTNRSIRSRLAAVSGRLDLEIDNTGVAVARELARRPRWRLWGGVAVAHSRFSLDATTRRFRTIRVPGDSRALTGPADLSDANEVDRHRQVGDDSGVAATAGLLWKSEGDRWSAGLVYRWVSDFDFDYSFRWQQKALAEAAAAGNPDLADPGIERGLSGASRFETPDVASLGLAYRPARRVLLTLEYARVGYSRLAPEDNLLVNVVRTSTGNCGDFDSAGRPQVPPRPCRASPGRMSNFEIDDADELHAGLEVVFGRDTKWSLRAGAWLDPDHQLRFVFGPPDVGPGQPVTVDNLRIPLDRLVARFPAGEDEWHWTGGFGVVPSRERWQVDLGFDLSDRAEVFSLSTVFRW